MAGRHRIALKSALLTVLTLFGGILVGVGLGDFVFRMLPGHSMTDPAPLQMAVAAIPLVMALLAGGAGWGIAMGRFAGSDERGRLARAGILGFMPVTVLLAFLLLWLEGIVMKNFGDQIPIHRVFTILFVPTAFLIGGVSAWAIGVGLRDNGLAGSLFWKIGLAAALAFLVVNLVMEASGWEVGAPGAAERATMIVVMSLGNLAAALVGGGLLGLILDGRRRTSGAAPVVRDSS